MYGFKYFKMKKILNFIIIFLLFTSNIFAADEIEKGKTLLKTLSKKSLTKEETISFLKEYAIILEDERGDGEVTYVFDDENYIRYKGIEVISTDAWRFSKLGAMRLFNKDIKLTWKIKLKTEKTENLINIKTKFDPIGKLYKFTVMDKKDFLDQIEQIKLVEKQKKEAAKKAEIEKKKKQEEEKLAAEQKLEEEKRKLEEERLAAEQKLEEEKRILEEEKLALQKEIENQKKELEKQKKKAAEELTEAKKTPEQKKKEKEERKKADRIAEKKRLKEEKERINAEKLAKKKRLKEEEERIKAEKLAKKKRLKEEEEKLKAKQKYKALYLSVINDKWGMQGISCNMNGGSYHRFLSQKGEMFYAGGKIQDGGGMARIVGEIKQISADKFTATQILFPTPSNKLVYGAIGNRPSAKVHKTYTIINEDLLKFKSEIQMIDLDAILNGYKGDQVGYTYKTEFGTRVRCN